jgi:hypothetical protein
MSVSDTPTGDKPQAPQAAKPATSQTKPKPAPARAARTKVAPRKTAATKKRTTRSASSARSKRPQPAGESRISGDPYQSVGRVWPD